MKKGPMDPATEGDGATVASPWSSGPMFPECLSEPGEPTVGAPPDRALELLPPQLLHGDETLLLLLKPSPLYIVLGSLGSLLLLAAVGWVVPWLGRRFQWGAMDERPLQLLCVVLAVGRLTWQTMDWMGRVYVLTDRRVIRLMGVFHVQLFQAQLRDLRPPRVQWNLLERLFGLGTLVFATHPSQIPEAFWVMLARPLDIQKKIEWAIERYAR